MRVIFDYRAFNWQPYGGIQRYFCEIANHLDQIAGVEARILAGLHGSHYLDLYNAQLTIGLARPCHPVINRICYPLNRLWSDWWLARHSALVVHTTYYDHQRWAPKHCLAVLTVYDMMHEIFADTMPATEASVIACKAQAVANADRIICPSENTKRDLLRFYPQLLSENITVIYHGYGLMTNSANLPTQPRPYILYVGNRGWYKNFDRLLQAYGQHTALSRDFNLICFGGGTWSATERHRLAQLGLSSTQVIQMTGDDADLLGLYRQAAVFIYPSLYEGFGYPPLEAMAAGCPVACSNTSCFPETVNQAAELFDPMSVPEIQNALEQVLYHPSRAAELIALGYRHIQKFSWPEAAQQHLKVYQS